VVRNGLIAPRCTEGTHFCGIPVWRDFYSLAEGHFNWFKAMEEKGCPPIDMLKAATSNIAAAYGKSGDLGTVQVGKIADLVILERNPLDSAENYRHIMHVIKDGAIVDRASLPTRRFLTWAQDPDGDQVTSSLVELKA